jgi:pyridoxamine 5'-phosphate oxidase
MTDVIDRRARPFFEADASSDPLAQFAAWFGDARTAGLELPEAMALATVGADGHPSVRMVLLKDFGERGFVFYSGYESRKAHDLVANRHAALLFYWHDLGRQVRVEGTVERLPHDDSVVYFQTRPLASRLAAWASHQSEPIAGREELERAFEAARAQYPGDDVPLPPHWGGFRLAPDLYEFWQHREDRLHDRLRYTRAGGGWRRERLAP